MNRNYSNHIHPAGPKQEQYNCIACFWAVQRPLGSMFAVLWYEMSYENVLRRFGDFCIVVEAVLCTAQRLNINPCSNKKSISDSHAGAEGQTCGS